MRRTRKIAVAVLVLLLAATIYGLVRTGSQNEMLSASNTVAGISSEHAADVDQTPLLTAQKLAQMPTSSAELPFAQQALQVADQEMDLAFASALLDVTEHPPTLS